MKKVKKLIFISFLLIIFLSVILIVLGVRKKINDNNYEPTSDETSEVTDDRVATEEDVKEAQEELNVLYDRSFYFSIKELFNNYLENVYKANNEYYIQREDEAGEIKKEILGVLDSTYVKDNNISVNNMKYGVNTKDLLMLEIVEMKRIQSSDVMSYAVYGVLINNAYQYKDTVYFKINFDKTNFTYSIEFIDKVDNLSDVKSTDIKEIKENDFNTYLPAEGGTEKICKDYIERYKRFSLINPSLMYNLLNKEYREKRFGNLDNFKKYVSENKDEISKVTLAKYSEKEADDNTVYVCLDTNKKYYIIKEKDLLNYEMFLDAYTVDILNTKDKYMKASDNEKIGINMDKIILALNEKNYNYIYNSLESNFKKDNYPTLESLENYLKKNLYEKNLIKGRIYTNTVKNAYTYTIDIINAEKEEEKQEVSFEMYLNDGVDFNITFKIK